MTKNITLYYEHALSRVVRKNQGFTDKQLTSLETKIAKITEQMAKFRKCDELKYRDLPYNLEGCKEINDKVMELKGKYDNLVILGIGGSALGSIALHTALTSSMYNLLQDRPGPKFFVMDNVDPVQFGALLKYLDGQFDRTLFNVVSLSGETPETAAELFAVLKKLYNKSSGANLADHIIATTDASRGTLHQIVEDMGLPHLDHPESVPGRFSVLSNVGLFGAAMCGINIDEILKGARDMDERVKNPNLRENPAALYAVIQFILYNKGKHISVIMPYSYQLKDLGDWYRQLWAESLGKSMDLKGKIVNKGPTPITALGTTDQHSQVQLYREGPNDKVFTFLQVKKFDDEVIIGDASKYKNLRYLSGKKMSRLMNSSKQGTEYALIVSNRPCLTINFPQVTPYSVGQFIYLLEVATSYMGALFNIMPYDQPAVELGKEAAKALMGKRGQDYSRFAKDIRQPMKTNRKYIV